MVDVAGKVAVVTGATGGIGKEIARGLAERGAKVVLAARDEAKLAAAADELGAESVRLDLSSFANVRAAAQRLRARHPRIDLLVNNAGIHTSRYELTEDGFETTFQVNHLAAFLLVRELLPALVAASPGRVVNVASEAHRAALSLDLDLLLRARGWDGIRAYAQTKLCNILTARELARRHGDALLAFSAHPGVVRTAWARGRESGLFRFGVALASPFMLSPRQGARTPLAACTDDGAENGSYFFRRKVGRPSRAARDDDAARLLWVESERLLAPPPGTP